MHEVLTDAFATGFIIHYVSSLTRQSAMDKFDDATKVSFFPALSYFSFLTLTTQQELSQFIEQEQAQARVQESIHKMTSMCWDKYVYFSRIFRPLLSLTSPAISQVRDRNTLEPLLSLRRVLPLALRRPFPRLESQTRSTDSGTEKRGWWRTIIYIDID